MQVLYTDIMSWKVSRDKEREYELDNLVGPPRPHSCCQEPDQTVADIEDYIGDRIVGLLTEGEADSPGQRDTRTTHKKVRNDRLHKRPPKPAANHECLNESIGQC